MAEQALGTPDEGLPVPKPRQNASALNGWAGMGTRNDVPLSVRHALTLPGEALSQRHRHTLEPRFGADFSSVRIHNGDAAARSAGSIGARAYTMGTDIVFGRGEFNPDSPDGRRLLAHELAHTLQQARAPIRIQRKGGDPLDELNEVSGDTIQTIIIDPGSGRTRFLSVSGKHFDGKVTSLASGFKQGDYLLEHATKKGRTWNIFNQDGSVYRGGLQFDVELAGTDFDSLGYTPQVKLKVVSGLLPQLIDIEARIKAIKNEVGKNLVNDAEEQALLKLLEDIPAEQADAFVQRLRQEQVSGTPMLERLDRDIDGANNIALHQLLSRLKLQAGGAKTARSLADAPTLAWHDVMGFFEQKAVFSVTPSGNGKYRIRYLGAITGGLYDSPQYAEIKNMGRSDRLNIMTGQGIEVNADQPIIVHDYDSDQQVVLTAEDLIAYQHAGTRKFLQDIGTIASLATPAGAETVGARVLAYGVQIATAATLIVDENKLNIRKWFPNWGPAIIEASEKIKIAIAIVGVAQLVQGGWKLFANLQRLRAARAVMDAKALASSAEELAMAEKQAAQLEANADKLLSQAELARKELGIADNAAQAVDSALAGTTHDATAADNAASKITQPSTGSASKSSAAHGPSAMPEPQASANQLPGKATPSGDPLANLNQETSEMLGRRPEIKTALEKSPRAARILKKCQSPCYPDFASPTQIDRIERTLEAAEDAGLFFEEKRLTDFLRGKGNWHELEQGIDELENSLTRAQDVKGEFKLADQKLGRDRFTPEGRPETSAMRAQPGMASGGLDLPDVTGQWFPQARNASTGRAIAGTRDGRIAQIPGQIARRMKGMAFRNFDDFRQTFWRMVANDPVLNQGWSPGNLDRMRQGLAPFAPTAERVGGGSNSVYQLNHKQALKNGGDVYNLNNIEIVGPATHQAVGD